MIPIQTVFESKTTTSPKISIILLDWACRESFHSLKYLNEQDTARELYEIIWIEYYSNRPTELESAIKQTTGKPWLDRWIVMGMPESYYYHKHLMYNLGIIEARGEIVVICDSDAIFNQSFVRSIINSFENNKEIVLHLDEVRNVTRRFYPFNYPDLQDVLAEGCINWNGNTTRGLIDEEDSLHTRNYGACMCARREDLLEIGGADEHIDYLGHICGPYEMTFRLLNAGKHELWHKSEFLYHTWHPGTDGTNNRLGPHDGLNVSTTALEVKRTKQILPHVENPAIKALRLATEEVLYAPLLEQAIPYNEIRKWTLEALSSTVPEADNSSFTLSFSLIQLKLIQKQIIFKLKKFTRKPHSIGDIVSKISKGFKFLMDMFQYNKYIIKRCTRCIETLVSGGTREIALFGANDMTEIMLMVSKNSGMSVKELYGYNNEEKSFLGYKVRPISSVKGYKGTIVIVALNGTEEKLATLKKAGVPEERIVTI